MTETSEVRIAAKDLQSVTLVCPRKDCATEITIDLSIDKHRGTDWSKKSLQCAGCGHDFGKDVTDALSSFAGWLNSVERSVAEIFFRIKRA